jgi:YVTN family beta-propeller protein
VISPKNGGVAFTANGGTDDVSVIDVTKILANAPGAELARIPVGTGPWGIAVSPDGAWVATANRESARADAEGNHVSLISVDKAVTGAKDAEAARLIVGTNNPSAASRPFGVAVHARRHDAARLQLPRQQPLVRRRGAGARGRPRRGSRAAAARDNRQEAFAAARHRDHAGWKSMRRSPARREVSRTAGCCGSSTSRSGRTVGRVSGVGNETYLLALLP